jgi:hypothetical protein
VGGGLVYVAENNELLTTIELQAAEMSIMPEGLFGYIRLSDYVEAEPCPDGDCDDGSVVLSGFDFTFYGQHVTDLVWSTNGFLQAATDLTEIDGPNQHFPDPTEPNNLIAPLWADLNLEGCSIPDLSGAWYRVFASVNEVPYYIFEWENAALKDDPTQCFTFQVWIKTGTDEIWFIYGPQSSSLPYGTVGIEDQEGNTGYTVFYNGVGSAPVEGSSLKAIRITDQATFTYDLEIGADLSKNVVNVAEATNIDNGQVIQASTAVQVGERVYLPILIR